jgi:DNA-directed RNA polymerase II subunit RPB1
MLVFSISNIESSDDEEGEISKVVSNDEIISRLHILETDMLNKEYIQGIEGIKKVYIEKIPGTNNKYIETEGSNILGSFNIPELDHTRTVCNDIIEVCDILGIEAGRKVLFDEIRNVISFDGTSINYRHIALIADIITYRGFWVALSRHGLNRASETSTLLKSSFEETMDVLVDAATYSQKDLIKSISEHIILGKLAPFGTGSFDINFNNESVKQYLSDVKDVPKVVEEVVEDVEVKDKRFMSDDEDEEDEDDDDEDVYIPS